MGVNEKLMANLFQMACEVAPSIIFIDEIDSLCGTHGEGNENETYCCIKTKLLMQMGAYFLRCTKILSQHHPFLFFLPSIFLPCKDTFMDDYDGI
jgi:vacuolar protein-sorting-associated protein 4